LADLGDAGNWPRLGCVLRTNMMGAIWQTLMLRAAHRNEVDHKGAKPGP
jgi:hypothetical protein